MSPIYFLVLVSAESGAGRRARGDRGRAFINSRARVLPLPRAHHDRDGAETRTRASSINSFCVPINLDQKIIVLLVTSQPMGSLSLFLRVVVSHARTQTLLQSSEATHGRREKKQRFWIKSNKLGFDPKCQISLDF